MTEPGSNDKTPQRRTLKQVLLSYFYWTYPRGNFHYDVMVTVILLFIFVTPHLWNYGDKPNSITGPAHPIMVVGNDGHGVIVAVEAQDVNMPANPTPNQVKKALRDAIEPVTGDDVFVEHWETATDAQGKISWRVWIHR